MPERRCGHGGCLWVVDERDVYCGFCGHRLALLKWAPKEVAVYADRPEARGPFLLVVTNDGRNPIRWERGYLDCGIRPTWDQRDVLKLVRTGDEREAPEGQILRSGEHWTFQVTLPREVLRCPGKTGQLCIQTSAGLAMLAIEVRSSLDLDVSICPEELVGRKKHPVLMAVRCRRGPAEIERIVVSPEWASVSDGDPPADGIDLRPVVDTALLTSAKAPVRLEAGDTGLLPLTVDGALLGRETKCVLKVRFDARWCKEPVTKELGLRYAEAPQLEVQGPPMSYIGLLEGEREVPLGWKLTNSGGLDLDITSVTIEPEGPGFLEQRAPKAVPVRVAGKGVVALEMVASAEGLARGRHKAAVRVKWRPRTADAQEQELALSVQATVDEIQAVGEVAFDFGTTSSCGAVWDAGAGTHRLVEMEPSSGADRDTKVMPTAVIYEPAGSGVRPWCFGSKALELGPLPGFAPMAVLSVKREIGCDHPWSEIKPPSLIPLKPPEIVGDILADLQEKVVRCERHRPARAYMTVPAMFCQFERDALRQAAARAGFPQIRDDEEERHLVEEPIAAASAFFFDRQKRIDLGLPDEYTLLVCDIGGGTTDICLLKVSDLQVGKVRRLQVDILAVGGNPCFGGDDITQRLAERIRSLCAESDPEKFPVIPVAHKAGKGVEYANWVAENLAEFWTVAEKAKKELAEKEEYKIKSFKLRSAEGPKDYPTPELPLRAGDLVAAVESPLKGIERMIRGLIDQAAADPSNKVAFRNKCPDFLYLAGRTCRIRYIREYLQSRFGVNGSHFDDKFCKECVVAGAIDYYHHLRGGPDFEFVPVSKANCSPIAVGIDLPASGHAGMKFATVIPQFGKLDEPHTLKLPSLRMATVEYNVYQHYAPQDSEEIRQNSSIRHIGFFKVAVPANVRRGCSPDNPFEIRMKLVDRGRRLQIEVAVGKWTQKVEFQEALGRR